MIEVDELVRRLGKTLVLDRLSFTAQRGQTTGFLGPNGAGKTTTIRVLGTLLRPHAGSVRIAGYDVVTQAHDVRRSIGLVTEETGVLDRLTVREQLEVCGRAHDLAPDRLRYRLDDMADLLGLGEFMDQRAGRLSKGTRQKAAVARALLHDPPVLLLDEPTANLDVLATGAILELLRRPELKQDKTVLLATHRLEEAASYTDVIVAIAHGRTVVTGTPNEIAERAGADNFAEGFLRLLGRAEMEHAAETETEAEAEAS